jgi:hypothetical protein
LSPPSSGTILRVTLPTNILVNYSLFDSQETQRCRRGKQESRGFGSGQITVLTADLDPNSALEKNGMSFLKMAKERDARIDQSYFFLINGTASIIPAFKECFLIASIMIVKHYTHYMRSHTLFLGSITTLRQLHGLYLVAQKTTFFFTKQW